MEIRKVRKHGNSLGLCIPRKYLEALNVKVNDMVIIGLEESFIVIRKLEDKDVIGGKDKRCN